MPCSAQELIGIDVLFALPVPDRRLVTEECVIKTRGLSEDSVPMSCGGLP